MAGARGRRRAGALLRQRRGLLPRPARALWFGPAARLSSPHGSAVLEVAIEEGQAPGNLFAPIHWSGETSSSGRIGALVHAIVDPFSGQPDAKATPAAVVPEPMALRG